MDFSSLKNSLGRMYGGSTPVEVGGQFPVWLERLGEATYGAQVNLKHAYKSGLTIADVYSDGEIRTGTMCCLGTNKNLIPIPTYRVVEPITSTATKIVLAGWMGMPTVKSGMELQTVESTPKVITVKANGATKNADGNYEVTITADALGVLPADSVLILKEAAELVPEGLSSDNFLFKGLDLNQPSAVGNMEITDRGRILEDVIAPVPAMYRTNYLQTIKFTKR